MQGAKDLRKTGTPLAATLERLAARETGDEEIYLSARLGGTEEGGWVTPDALASDTGLLEDLMRRIGSEYGSENRAYAGTALLKGYLWRVLAPAVAAFLSERRVPDLRPENVALRFGEGGCAEGLTFLSPGFAALPTDPEASHPDARVLHSEEEMLAFARDRLAEGHVPALIPALRDLRVRRGTRVLWGAAVDVVAETFMFVGRELGCEEEALGFAERLLSGPAPLRGPTNYSTLEYDGGSETTRIRNTCCLYYKVADGTCFTCPRTTDEERLERMKQW
jgi:hypothetical protein